MTAGQLKTIKALLILILLGFIWGSGYSLAKFAMSNGVPPLGYSFWQSLGPAIVLLLLCFLTGINPLTKLKYWPFFLVSGLVGIAIPNTNMYFIASHLSPGLLALLVNTVPLFVYPLALLTRQERPDPWRLCALLLGMSGIVFIVGLGHNTSYSNWAYLTLLSPLAFALSSIYIGSKQPPEMSILEAATGMLIAASLFLTPLTLNQHAFYSLARPVNPAQHVVILEIILSSIGYVLFFHLIRISGPVFYSLTGCVVALTGLFWAYLLFGEVPSPKQNLATILIILALSLLSWRQGKQQSSC